MKLLKNGFNLGEMLICIGLIAVVVAMMIPAAMSRKPAKNKALFRKAYYNTEKVVYDLVNNEDKDRGFPGTKSGDFSAGADQSTAFGYFKNSVTVKIPAGNTYSSLPRKKENTGKYLCSQIVAKMNTSGDADCVNTHTMPGNGTDLGNKGITSVSNSTSPNFVTNDGVAWYITNGTICVNGRAGCTSDTWTTIKVDVNGSSPPNTDGGNDPDRFVFSFDPEGKMRVDTTMGKNHLKYNVIYNKQ